MPGTKISQRIRTLKLAHDCAGLGARIRTIHHLTGLRPRELLYLLFNAHAQPPCGRAPNSREWYHNANLLQRIEASIVIANFRRMRLLGFPAAEALVGAYRYYQSIYRPPPRISFDRAFDLAAHTEGLWIAKLASFRLASCTRCGSEFLDALAGADTMARSCPFCQLVDRHARDPRLTASFAEPPPVSEDLIAHLMTVQGSLTEANGETPSTSPSLPAAET
ncbi:MAG: FlhC family transcriptional regulator [Gammaproteobacteria bacterium]